MHVTPLTLNVAIITDDDDNYGAVTQSNGTLFYIERESNKLADGRRKVN